MSYKQVGNRSLAQMNRDNVRRFADAGEFGGSIFGGKKELSVLKTPTGKFMFVGSVPEELSYEPGNGNIWATREAAVEAARKAGYSVK